MRFKKQYLISVFGIVILIILILILGSAFLLLIGDDNYEEWGAIYLTSSRTCAQQKTHNCSEKETWYYGRIVPYGSTIKEAIDYAYIGNSSTFNGKKIKSSDWRCLLDSQEINIERARVIKSKSYYCWPKN